MIAEHLEAVERGDIDRLMIFMPPRHGKSELASVRFPAWYLGKNPTHQIITASYAHKLAAKFGRQVRNLIASRSYQDVFPGVELSEDSQAKDLFNTNYGGTYLATGVDGSVTGSGAHIVSIDDPVKGRQEADSEAVQETAWDWYRGDLYTRLMPDAKIVLTQTRWNEADLAGRILESEGTVEEGGQWTVLDLPAINKQGEALWPEWFDVDALQRIKEAIGPREWSALYQQKPQPDEGSYFQKGWFKRWTNLPTVHVYGTSDYATKDGSGDFTVHQVWGLDAQGDLYMIDMWRGQATSDVWIERLCDLIDLYKPLAWFGEAGPIWSAVKPAAERRMRERGTMVRMEALPSISDKPTSARAFQARAATGRVYLPETSDGDNLLDELLRFPAGKWDDQVDACSKIGRAIDEMHPAIVKTVVAERNPADYKDYHKRRRGIATSAWA